MTKAIAVTDTSALLGKAAGQLAGMTISLDLPWATVNTALEGNEAPQDRCLK